MTALTLPAGEPLVACPGLACATCGTGLAVEHVAPAVWAWVHAGVRPPGCPALIVPRVRVVYLCELDPPYLQAGHYLGSTEDLPSRLRRHLDGHGARLLATAVPAGSRLVLVRLWLGGRELERRLKQAHNNPRLCPRCTPSRARTPAHPALQARLAGVA